MKIAISKLVIMVRLVPRPPAIAIGFTGGWNKFLVMLWAVEIWVRY